MLYAVRSAPSVPCACPPADQAAPSTAAAAAAPTAATGASPQAESTGGDKAKSASDGGGGGGIEELWIVGRAMENMDTRLGAKQEKIREWFSYVSVVGRAKKGRAQQFELVYAKYSCIRTP